MKQFTDLEHSHKLLHEIEPIYSYESCDDISVFQESGKRALEKLIGIDKIKSCTDHKISIEFDKIAEDLGCREIRFIFEIGFKSLKMCGYMFDFISIKFIPTQ